MIFLLALQRRVQNILYCLIRRPLLAKRSLSFLVGPKPQCCLFCFSSSDFRDRSEGLFLPAGGPPEVLRVEESATLPPDSRETAVLLRCGCAGVAFRAVATFFVDLGCQKGRFSLFLATAAVGDAGADFGLAGPSLREWARNTSWAAASKAPPAPRKHRLGSNRRRNGRAEGK